MMTLQIILILYTSMVVQVSSFQTVYKRGCIIRDLFRTNNDIYHFAIEKPDFNCKLRLKTIQSTFFESNYDQAIDLIGTDPFKYWFMFPASMSVAFCAITSGIGGAALFGPIFLILFPIIGSEYVLKSTGAAIGTAILIETFGFTSGLIGYLRRNLIDYKLALNLCLYSLPTAYLSSEYLKLPDFLLKVVYTFLMFAVSFTLLNESEVNIENEDKSDPSSKLEFSNKIMDRSGNTYEYPFVTLKVIEGLIVAFGGILCGLLGVGIGETILPQLVSKKVPIPVAAATSTLVVALTCFACAGIQISALIREDGINAIPWNLVVFMIPGVVIGAQIAATLQGKIPENKIKAYIGVLFSIIGLFFTIILSKQVL